MLWQRASSQSPCGARMLIECNHRNPRGLAPGSSQFLINWKKDYYFFAGSPREVPPWIFRVYGSMARSAGRIYRAGYLLLQFNILVMNLLCNYYRRAGTPRPLSIADFRLPRTHVVLVHASIARGIIWVRIKKKQNTLLCVLLFCLFFGFLLASSYFLFLFFFVFILHFFSILNLQTNISIKGGTLL